MGDISDFGTYFEDTYVLGLTDFSSHPLDNLDVVLVRNTSGTDMRQAQMSDLTSYFNGTLAFDNYSS